MSVAVARARASVARSSASRALTPVERQVQRREINEQIREFGRRLSLAEEIELVCECERWGCFETIHVSPRLYEDVRRFPTRFLVKVGHDTPESDRAVTVEGRVVVVEKVRPDDAEASIRTDPRREGAPADSVEHAEP